jgi:hypothetical protein
MPRSASAQRCEQRHPPHDAAAIARWRAELVAIARDEMVHLALVSNLLNAIVNYPGSYSTVQSSRAGGTVQPHHNLVRSVDREPPAVISVASRSGMEEDGSG